MGGFIKSMSGMMRLRMRREMLLAMNSRSLMEAVGHEDMAYILGYISTADRDLEPGRQRGSLNLSCVGCFSSRRQHSDYAFSALGFGS